MKRLKFYSKTLVCLLSLVCFFAATPKANASPRPELKGTLRTEAVDYIKRRPEEALYFKPEKDKRIFRVRFGKRAEKYFRDHRESFTRRGVKVKITPSLIRSGNKNTSALLKAADFEIDSIDLDQNQSATALLSSVTTPIGTRRIAAVVVNVQVGGTTYPSCVTPSYLQTLLFGGSPDLNGFFQETSYGLFNITGDVFGPVTVSSATNNCEQYYSWGQAAYQQMANQGVNLGTYDHVIYYFPFSGDIGCPWAGRAVMPGAEVYMVSSSLAAVAHELGHNFGLNHAGSDPDNDGVVNNEYGDFSCTMGGPSYTTRFNGPHTMQLGWLHAVGSQVVELSAAGTYFQDIAPLELDPATISVPQLIKVSAPIADLPYYVSFRREIGNHSNLAANGVTADKVYLHRYGNGSTFTYLVKGLFAGGSFYDRYLGARITVQSISGNNAQIKVDIGEGDYDHDGLGNNSDPDDDNDLTLDVNDCAPSDNTKWRNQAYRDVDLDGVREGTDFGHPDCFGTTPPIRYTLNAAGNDNCPGKYNPNQADADGDGIGNVCDDVVPSVQGDYNNNSCVENQDYNYWRSKFGNTVSPGVGADGNGNGVIDAADYTVWRNNLGAGTCIVVP